jgi:hypothetical protein
MQDTARWRRERWPNSPISFALPRSFSVDTSDTWRPVEGGIRWLEGPRTFDLAGGIFGAGSFPDDSVQMLCRTKIGGLQALVGVWITPTSSQFGVVWPAWPRVAIGGASANAADLTLFWTIARTVDIDSSRIADP